jgi:hypothetical protein
VVRVPAAGLWLTITAVGLGAVGLGADAHEDALALGVRLAALGPAPDERLAAAAASDDERRALRRALASANAASVSDPTAADALAAEHGARAVATLTAVLHEEAGTPDVARARLAARTLLVLADGRADARWLAWYFDAPGALLRAYGRSPDLDRDLDRTLTALAGGARRHGAAEWADWCLEGRRAFEDAEQRAAERRDELRRRLALTR